MGSVALHSVCGLADEHDIEVGEVVVPVVLCPIISVLFILTLRKVH